MLHYVRQFLKVSLLFQIDVINDLVFESVVSPLKLELILGIHIEVLRS